MKKWPLEVVITKCAMFHAIKHWKDKKLQGNDRITIYPHE